MTMRRPACERYQISSSSSSAVAPPPSSADSPAASGIASPYTPSTSSETITTTESNCPTRSGVTASTAHLSAVALSTTPSVVMPLGTSPLSVTEPPVPPTAQSRPSSQTSIGSLPTQGCEGPLVPSHSQAAQHPLQHQVLQKRSSLVLSENATSRKKSEGMAEHQLATVKNTTKPDIDMCKGGAGSIVADSKSTGAIGVTEPAHFVWTENAVGHGTRDKPYGSHAQAAWQNNDRGGSSTQHHTKYHQHSHNHHSHLQSMDGGGPWRRSAVPTSQQQQHAGAPHLRRGDTNLESFSETGSHKSHQPSHGVRTHNTRYRRDGVNEKQTIGYDNRRTGPNTGTGGGSHGQHRGGGYHGMRETGGSGNQQYYKRGGPGNRSGGGGGHGGQNTSWKYSSRQNPPRFDPQHIQDWFNARSTSVLVEYQEQQQLSRQRRGGGASLTDNISYGTIRFVDNLPPQPYYPSSEEFFARLQQSIARLWTAPNSLINTIGQPHMPMLVGTTTGVPGAPLEASMMQPPPPSSAPGPHYQPHQTSGNMTSLMPHHQHSQRHPSAEQLYQPVYVPAQTAQHAYPHIAYHPQHQPQGATVFSVDPNVVSTGMSQFSMCAATPFMPSPYSFVRPTNACSNGEFYFQTVASQPPAPGTAAAAASQQPMPSVCVSGSAAPATNTVMTQSAAAAPSGNGAVQEMPTQTGRAVASGGGGIASQAPLLGQQQQQQQQQSHQGSQTRHHAHAPHSYNTQFVSSVASSRTPYVPTSHDFKPESTSAFGVCGEEEKQRRSNTSSLSNRDGSGTARHTRHQSVTSNAPPPPPTQQRSSAGNNGNGVASGNSSRNTTTGAQNCAYRQ